MTVAVWRRRKKTGLHTMGNTKEQTLLQHFSYNLHDGDANSNLFGGVLSLIQKRTSSEGEQTPTT